jgi:drug/metabolite transporter (DMT)-like permease
VNSSSDEHRHRRLGALIAVVAAAAFASLAILGRWALDSGLRGSTLLQWRFLLAALVLVPFGVFRTPLPRRTRLVLLGSGFVYTAQTSFYFQSLDRITAGTTALLLYLSPAFIVGYSMLLGRRPSRGQTIATFLALAGLAVILGGPSAADADAIGLAFGAAAGATFAGYLLLGELAFGGVPPLTIAAYSMAGAVIGFTALELIIERELTVPSGSRQWLLVAAVVVVPTLLAIPLMFAAIARIGAGPTAIISTSEPAFTLAFAAVLLSEPIRAPQLLGGVLILGAAILAQRTATASVPPVLRFPVDTDQIDPV